MVRAEAAILNRASVLRLAAPAVALVALLLLAPLAPEPRGAGQFRVQAYATHAVYFLAMGWFVLGLCGVQQLTRRRLTILLLALVAAVMVGNLMEWPVVTDLFKIAFGGVAGHAFVRAIERPWWLIPICVCVPLADAWSVFSSKGVTNAVIERAESNPTWIEWPTIATPIAGFPYDAFGRIGIVDVLFLGLFLGASIRWQLGVKRVLAATTLGFLATSALVFEGADIAVPALPLLCVAFLLAAAPALWRDARAAWTTD